MKYTYACPGGPYMTSVRAVRPREECAARSRGPRYASVSTMRPVRTALPSSCTRCMPMSSRAMASVLRAKNACGSFSARLTARDGKGILYNRRRREADASAPSKRRLHCNQFVTGSLRKSHEAAVEIGMSCVRAGVAWPAGGPRLGQCLPSATGRFPGGGERREHAGGVRGHAAGYRAPLQSRLLRNHSREHSRGFVVAWGGSAESVY